VTPLEGDTRIAFLDPALHAAGWTEELIRREETPGAVEIVDGRPRRAGTGRTDYTLRIKVTQGAQPVAVAVVEAKRADAAPTRGLDQAKEYAREYAQNAARLHVPFVYATNGHLWVEYDATTGLTTAPAPMADFPSPNDLRVRWEAARGLDLTSKLARPLSTPYRGGETSRRYYQDAAWSSPVSCTCRPSSPPAASPPSKPWAAQRRSCTRRSRGCSRRERVAGRPPR
jgi:type I restriction enzyme R subunit